MKNFKPVFLDTVKKNFLGNFRTLIKSQLQGLEHDTSLNRVLWLFVVADFAWKTKSRKKTKTHPTNKFLPIFNGRNN